MTPEQALLTVSSPPALFLVLAILGMLLIAIFDSLFGK
jgi:hypothetical protein